MKNNYKDFIYKGVPFYIYCQNNGINYYRISYILKHIYKSSKYNNLTDLEKYDLAIYRYYNPKRYKYGDVIIDGKNIFEYLKDLDIEYKAIVERIKHLNNDTMKSKLPIEIKVKIAVEMYYKYTKDRISNIIYHGLKLNIYCKNNGINYKSIYWRLAYLRKKNSNDYVITTEDIDNSIESYLKKEELKKQRKNFEMLCNVTNEKELKQGCKLLNINLSKLKSLNVNLNLKELAIITHYCADKENKYGCYISKKKLKEVLSCENNDINVKIALLKIKYPNSFEHMCTHERPYIMGIMKKNILSNNLYLDIDDYLDMYDEMQIVMLEIINKCASKYPGQIVNYLYKTLFFKAKKYIVKNFLKKECEYLDEIKYS